MRTGSRLATLLACTLLAGAATAGAAPDKPVMTWLIQDFPPLAKPVNGKPSDGVTDVLLKLIAHAWPDVEHRYQITNVPRALALLASGDPACTNGLLVTPERERYAYFSPTNFVIPLQVITRPEVARELPRNTVGEVLLEPLLGSASMRGVVMRHRSYTPVVDEALKGPGASARLEVVTQAAGGGNVLKMVALGRADYTFDYDFALTYQQRLEPAFYKDKHLVTLPIAGTAPAISGIACPRTPWGREMITKIDVLVARLARNPAYVTAADPWLTPESRQRYKDLRAEFFRKRQQVTDPARFDPAPATPAASRPQ